MSTRLPRGPDYGAGIGASVIAEFVFIAMVMMVALVRGNDPWMVTRMPASFLLGPEAVQPPGFTSGDVALGMAMHLFLALLVGVIYAVALPRIGISPITGGLIAGAVLYLLGFWILPLAFPSWLAPFWLPPTGRALQAAAHAVYGAAFGLAYRKLAGPSQQ